MYSILLFLSHEATCQGDAHQYSCLGFSLGFRYLVKDHAVNAACFESPRHLQGHPVLNLVPWYKVCTSSRVLQLTKICAPPAGQHAQPGSRAHQACVCES